jgi:transposase
MIDEEKHVIREAKIPCEEIAVERFFGGRPKECLNVVMEACGIWYNLYDYLVERCGVVKVSNPTQTKLNSSGKKTDKLDSKRLAELLKADMINESYVPPKDARDYRSKIRHRQSMVTISTELKNMIYAVLRGKNIKHPDEFKDIFTKRGVRWLKTLGVSEIEDCLELIDAANTQIENAEHAISVNVYKKEIELLKTMSGVGDVTAPVIMSEIVDIKRFESPKALCKYAGLVPKVMQSGDSDRRGRLVKQSSKILRTALIQCAHGVLKKKEGKLKKFFLKMYKRKKYNTAVAALAHKMLYIMWFMLTNNEEFHDGGIPVGE